MFFNFVIERNRGLHLYHLVTPSPWPLFISITLLLMLSGLGFYFHRIFYGLFIFFLSFVALCFFIFKWFSDICFEASFYGLHTRVVRRGLIIGFFLFLASEIMLF
jgi:cytochrome c oxidase subunit 3